MWAERDEKDRKLVEKISTLQNDCESWLLQLRNILARSHEEEQDKLEAMRKRMAEQDQSIQELKVGFKANEEQERGRAEERMMRVKEEGKLRESSLFMRMRRRGRGRGRGGGKG